MHQQLFTNQASPIRRILFIGLAVLAYLFSLASIAWVPALSDVMISVALLGLGMAVSWSTLVNRPASTQAVGTREAKRWKRGRGLALVSVAAVYLALIVGSIVTTMGGLWSCTTLPLCARIDDPAYVALIHRGVSAFATLLVVALALWGIRAHREQALRRAAIWAVGTIVAQNLVGLLLVLAASNGESMSLVSTRLIHLGMGAVTWSMVVVLATLIVHIPPTDWSASPSTVPSTGATSRRSAATRSVDRRSSLLKDYISLTKPRVITLLVFTTLAVMFITPAGMPSLSLIFWTMLGGWLMPSGAHALNCYFDRDIDRKMGRTGRRPLPGGRIPAWHALALGLFLGALAFAILATFVNWAAAWVALVGYLYYAVIYTIVLKRHTVHNIVIGGGAGAIPPLVGWAAVTDGLTWASLLLFAIIFMWTPPHFWALALIRRKDYANAGIPMLPVVAGDDETKRQILIYTLITVGVSLLLTPAGMMGIFYLVAAALLGLVFVGYVLRMMRNDRNTTRWALYRFSLLYLFLLFVAMMLDRFLLG